ncbi:MAG: TonB-dependent receptor plug domain-containing protein, partial [Limisphaerales bacterium]
MNKPINKLAFCLAAFSCFSQTAKAASPAPARLDEVVVRGEITEPSAETFDKTVLSPEMTHAPISASLLTYDQISRLPYTTYGDLFQAVPGVEVNRYDQGGVPYGISLRGFDSGGHGKQVAHWRDGFPLNDVATMEPGVADLFLIIPQTLESVEVTRGPWNPRYGNYNLGGSVTYKTRDYVPSGLYLTAGTYDTYRALPIFGFRTGEIEGYSALLASTQGGYRENSYLDEINSFSKVAFPMLDGRGAVALQIYSSDGGAPGYVSRTGVQTGVVDPKTAVNPTDGSASGKQNLTFNYESTQDNGEFGFDLYAANADFKRWASFGGPANQSFRNFKWQTIGGRTEKYLTFDLPREMEGDVLFGFETRADFADVIRYNT